jgi:hypothetical protein
MSYRFIGSATTPLEIASLLQRRSYELGISGDALGNVAGLADRHPSKFECGTKGLGSMNPLTLLTVLGCKLILVCDDKKLPNIIRSYINSTKYKHL